MGKKSIIIGALIAVAGILGLSSVYTVAEQEQAIVLRLSAYHRIEDKPGLKFKLPLLESVVYYDKRVLDYEADLKEINAAGNRQIVVDVFVRYRIVDPLQFYRRANNVARFEGNLQVITRSQVQAVFAEHALEELLQPKRAEMMRDITARAKREAKDFGVDILDVRVKRIDLPQQNSDAVFARMETQRRQEATGIRAGGERDANAKRADADKEVRIIKAEAEKTSQILRGEGDAISINTLNAAFSQDVEFFKFWQCVQSVREGLATNTRYVGQLTSDIIWQLCDLPKAGADPGKKAER